MPIPSAIEKEIRALQHQANGVVLLAISDADYWVLNQALSNSMELRDRLAKQYEGQ